MPNDFQSVLFVWKDSKFERAILTGYFDESNDCWVSDAVSFLKPCNFDLHDDDLCFSRKKITHWMDCPKLPK